jgi:hypothetical protein
MFPRNQNFAPPGGPQASGCRIKGMTVLALCALPIAGYVMVRMWVL